VSGVSALDDLTEAIELPDRRFVLGVQWHPEADVASSVVGALVQAAGMAATRVDAVGVQAAGMEPVGRAQVRGIAS
jgi:putative glutamine amidotransferase